MTEDERRSNFSRVLEKRRSTILQEIQRLGNLKNQRYYSGSYQEITQTIKLIRSALKTTEAIFQNK